MTQLLLTVLALGLTAFGVASLPRGRNPEITMTTFMGAAALLAGIALMFMLFIVPVA